MKFHLTRDIVLFSLGMVLAINELILRRGDPNPQTLIFIGWCLGMPVTARFDERQRSKRT